MNVTPMFITFDMFLAWFPDVFLAWFLICFWRDFCLVFGVVSGLFLMWFLNHECNTNVHSMFITFDMFLTWFPDVFLT